MNRILATAIVASSVVVGTASVAGAAPHAPTCSTVLGIAVHGQHIVGDYVTGLHHGDLEWSPSGGVVGAAVGANRGPAIVGGPGPGFHFKEGVAPGASFCTGSASPGVHVVP